jgi:signal transduction histidine kinase
MLRKVKRNQTFKELRSIPLRQLLIVPFVAQIFAAVGLIGYLTLRDGHRAVNDFVNRSQNDATNRVTHHLSDFLEQPWQLTQINVEAIESGLLNPQDLKSIQHFFWHQMQLYDVGYIMFGSESGEFAASGRYEEGYISVDELSVRLNGNLNNYVYKTDDQGNVLKLVGVDPSYAFQQEAWYAKTVKAGRPIWSRIYQWETKPYTVAISTSRPIYNTNKKLIGVVATEQRLSQISDFLRQLEISPHVRTFILERDGLLVASSSTEQPFTIVDGKPKRLRALDSRDLLIRETAKQLTERFDNFSNIKSKQKIEFLINRELQFVEVNPWIDASGLNWLVVVVIPQSDFTGQINKSTRTTILLCLIALGIATLLGVYTSHWITQPILHLSQASKAIAAGDLNQQVKESEVDELGVLARSFNLMAKQLRDSFAALAETNQQLEKSNEALEIRVTKRTEELSRAIYDLQQTQAQLVQTEKMSSLGQMVAGVAHEINNPINFVHANLAPARQYIQDLFIALSLYRKNYPNPVTEIQNHLEDAELDFLLEDLPKLLNSMEEGTRRIREIVLNLRNFSRLDESQMKTVDIHEGIENTLLLLQHRLKKTACDRPIKIVKQYHDLPPVECYPGQLNQVFMNILSNAIDALEERYPSLYSYPLQKDLTQCNDQENPGLMELKPDELKSEDTPTIWISTKIGNSNFCQKPQYTHAVIRIRDNGFGISEEVRPRIFDPFFTTKPVGKGTGLGLLICYQIVVERHKGSLNCTSYPTVGTEFVVEIPLEQS